MGRQNVLRNNFFRKKNKAFVIWPINQLTLIWNYAKLAIACAKLQDLTVTAQLREDIVLIEKPNNKTPIV
jgi:hypothetical protein